MVRQKYRFTAENAEHAEATYLLHKGFSATSATSAVKKAFFATVLLGISLSASVAEAEPTERSMVVTATAFNSVPSQTDSNPSIAAWGDRLKPGMKAVAVSRDLIKQGLTRGNTLRIEGLEGEYVVLDKTASRHKKRVDIYMGTDVQKARQFGVRRLRIYWNDHPL
jgi:3D (Asp-Asp-Asp) domain-containing protein